MKNFLHLYFLMIRSQLLTQELADIAFYFNYYDKELSQNILVVDEIIKAYQKNENVLISRDDEIRRILSYLADNIEYITDIWFWSYTSFLKFVIDITDNKEDLYDMLGKYQERHYLVILQNTSEKRPKWMIFWLFCTCVSLSMSHHTVRNNRRILSQIE